MSRKRDAYVMREEKDTDLAIVCEHASLVTKKREWHLRGVFEELESPALCGKPSDFLSGFAPAQWRTTIPGGALEETWCVECEIQLGGVIACTKRLQAQDKDMRTELKPVPGETPMKWDDWDAFLADTGELQTA